jgi:hypothetical protein
MDGHKPQSFLPNRAPKMRESQQLIFGGRLVSRIFEEFKRTTIQTKIVQHFGGFFHQIKVHRPIGRKYSVQTVCQRSRRLEAFLYEAAQNSEVFSNIQDQNRNRKTYNGLCR